MADQDRDEQGQFTPEHDDEEFIAAVADLELAGTRDVADLVGVTRQNADRRLRQLEERGYVVSRKVGGTLVWMLAED